MQGFAFSLTELPMQELHAFNAFDKQNQAELGQLSARRVQVYSRMLRVLSLGAQQRCLQKYHQWPTSNGYLQDQEEAKALLHLLPSQKMPHPSVELRTEVEQSSQLTTSSNSPLSSLPAPPSDCLDAVELFLRPPTAKKIPRSEPGHVAQRTIFSPSKALQNSSVDEVPTARETTAIGRSFHSDSRFEGLRTGAERPSQPYHQPVTAAACHIAADEFTISSSFAIPVIPAGAVQRASAPGPCPHALTATGAFQGASSGLTVFAAAAGRASWAPTLKQTDGNCQVVRSLSLGGANLPEWGRQRNRPSLGDKSMRDWNGGFIRKTPIKIEPKSGSLRTPTFGWTLHSRRLDQVAETSIGADITNAAIDAHCKLASTSSSASSVCAELLSCRKIDMSAVKTCARPYAPSDSAHDSGLPVTQRPASTPKVIYRGGSIAASVAEADTPLQPVRQASQAGAPTLLSGGEGSKQVRPRLIPCALRPQHSYSSYHLTPNHLSQAPTAPALAHADAVSRVSKTQQDGAAGSSPAQQFAPISALEVSCSLARVAASLLRS